MSLSNDFQSFLSIPPLPPLSEPLLGCSFADSDLFLQESVQVAKASTCATSVFSGLAASIVTKNPFPLLIGFGGCLPRAHAQLKIGSTFTVNTYRTGYQGNAAITHLRNGTFVVSWQSSDDQDGSWMGIFGQLFTEDGNKSGVEFQVNTYTSKHQTNPSTTTLKNGNFVVIWQSLEQDGSGWGVFGQLFDGNANKIGNEFQVNNYTLDQEQLPSVISFSNGNFVVIWDSDPVVSYNHKILGQLFDENAIKIGNEFQVGTYLYQKYPVVASFSNDNFVVTWENNGDIFGQLFDGNANKIENMFTVNTGQSANEKQPSVTSLTNGNFVVTWASNLAHSCKSNYNIFGQLFDGNANKIGNEFHVNRYCSPRAVTDLSQEQPSVSILSDGSFVIVWQVTSTNEFKGIRGQLFDGNANKIGNEFPVCQTFCYSNDPLVTSLINGNFVVIWTKGSSGLTEVIGQIFNDVILTSSTSTFITSTTSANYSTITRRTTSPTSVNSMSSSPKLITWISLGAGGLVCFCLAPLGIFLLRKRKSQTGARLSEETGIRNTAFELDPVMERAHVVIGRTYYWPFDSFS